MARGAKRLRDRPPDQRFIVDDEDTETACRGVHVGVPTKSAPTSRCGQLTTEIPHARRSPRTYPPRGVRRRKPLSTRTLSRMRHASRSSCHRRCACSSVSNTPAARGSVNAACTTHSRGLGRSTRPLDRDSPHGAVGDPCNLFPVGVLVVPARVRRLAVTPRDAQRVIPFRGTVRRGGKAERE